MPRIVTCIARRIILSSPYRSYQASSSAVMRGKRIITAAAAAIRASALATFTTTAASASASSGSQVAVAAFGFAVPPPPPPPPLLSSSHTRVCTRSTDSRVGERCGSSITSRSYMYRSLATRTAHLPSYVRGIRLHAAATLDLSASSASNEYLHTLSEAEADDNANTNSNAQRPRPIVICGPSGVGKGTIINALLAKFPADKFGFSVSHTTRQPRPGEINGTHYNFVSVDQIQRDIAAGKFLEHAEVHGNYYGTSLEAVESVQSEGKLCVLDIDVQGVRTIQSQNKLEDAIYVFVAPPSVDNLEQRLRGRGTETEETLARRLGNAQREMEYGYGEGNFDYILVNGDLDVAVEELADRMRGWYPTLDDESDGKDAE